MEFLSIQLASHLASISSRKKLPHVWSNTHNWLSCTGFKRKHFLHVYKIKWNNSPLFSIIMVPRLTFYCQMKTKSQTLGKLEIGSNTERSHILDIIETRRYPREYRGSLHTPIPDSKSSIRSSNIGWGRDWVFWTEVSESSIQSRGRILD